MSPRHRIIFKTWQISMEIYVSEPERERLTRILLDAAMICETERQAELAKETVKNPNQVKENP